MNHKLALEVKGHQIWYATHYLELIYPHAKYMYQKPTPKLQPGHDLLQIHTVVLGFQNLLLDIRSKSFFTKLKNYSWIADSKSHCISIQSLQLKQLLKIMSISCNLVVMKIITISDNLLLGLRVLHINLYCYPTN